MFGHVVMTNITMENPRKPIGKSWLNGISWDITLWSKEVWKLNFRQYREMEMAQPGRNSDMEKVRREKIRDGESQQVRER